MTERELFALLQDPSMPVRSVGIVNRSDPHAPRWDLAGEFEVWIGVGPSKADAGGEPLTLDGEPWCFDTLSIAYDYVRQAGYRGTVEVDDAPRSPAAIIV